MVEASPARNIRAESLTEPAMSALGATGAYMTTLSDKKVSPEVKKTAVWRRCFICRQIQLLTGESRQSRAYTLAIECRCHRSKV